jgi:hypothetical protein
VRANDQDMKKAADKLGKEVRRSASVHIEESSCV